MNIGQGVKRARNGECAWDKKRPRDEKSKGMRENQREIKNQGVKRIL